MVCKINYSQLNYFDTFFAIPSLIKHYNKDDKEIPFMLNDEEKIIISFEFIKNINKCIKKMKHARENFF